MGGLVKDIRQFNDSANGIGGSPEASNRMVASHWDEASQVHGMPVNSKDFNLFSDDHPSTYPLNIAYKAVQLVDEELANIYLRLLREETIANGRKTNRKEVLIELANDVGVDIVGFIERLEDGSAEAAFNEDLKMTSAYWVMGFPAFLIRYHEKELLLRGFQSFERINKVISSMTKGEVLPKEIKVSEKEILAFVTRYNRVAPIEIQTTFNLSAEETNKYIISLINKKILKKIEMGNGYFVSIIDDLICDPVTGICTCL